MWIERATVALIRRMRGKDIRISPRLSASAVLANLVQKGLGPAIRGMWMRVWFKQSHGLLFIGRGCRILNKGHLSAGRNLYLGAYGYFDCLSAEGVSFGNNVTIRENCWLQLTSRYDQPGEFIRIGDNVYIGPRSILGAAAPLVIGNRCQIGANVSFIAENHAFEEGKEIFNQGVTRVGITIEDDVWIGNNVTILDGVTVGEGCVLGAGTVLTRSVPPRSVVVGVPGRVIKTR
jgi:acetyltransferase-like isoleucine patch superfamily enzyme